MLQTTKNNIYFVHTTHTIIDYINLLSKRYLKDIQVIHLLDESILADIKKGDSLSARNKLLHMVEGALHSGAEQIMITCTSTGQLIDALPAKYQSHIRRIESAAIEKLAATSGQVGIAHTNSTVWPEFQHILRKQSIPKINYMSAYIDQAFDKMLAGDKETHDQLVKSFLERNDLRVSSYLLAQVSLCSALERLPAFSDGPTLISMAELGIMSIRDNKE